MGIFGPPNIDRMKAKKDVSGLIKALDYQKDPSVCYAAAKALGEIGDKRSVNPLISHLKDMDSKLRRSIVSALGMIGGQSAIEALVASVNDENGNVRRASAKSLGNLEDPAAINALIAALSNEDKKVCENVLTALTVIGEPARPMLESARQNKDVMIQKLSGKALAKIDDAKKLADKKAKEREKIKKYTKKLNILLNEAYIYGEQNRWPLHRMYPQYDAIRKIGEALNKIGGHETMLIPFNYIARHNRKVAGMLEFMWHGIGTWIR